MDAANQHSGQLSVRSSGTSGFSQNGQVDWISFLRGTAEASISILMRLSACGVEPLTALVAQKVFAPLRLSPHGESSVHKALSSLRAFGSFGNVLWFGFGIQHITRSLAQTREGLGCVALCGALVECHSPEVSALILSAFADISSVPREVNPSLAQWRQLVQACGGCLTKSDFGDFVQGFVGRRWSDENWYLTTSNPEEIARALDGLTRVCSGELVSITFTGGPTCGWLGAVATWLLGLSVAILSDKQDTRESAQVRIVYTHSDMQASAALDIRKAYRLTDISALIDRELPRGSQGLCLRVPWHMALRSTFGDEPVRNLTLDLRKIFTVALGSAACLFELLVTADSGFTKVELQNNFLYMEGTYGRGLLNMVSSCFPEISTDITSSAIGLLGQAFNNASMAYEQAIFQLCAACPCLGHDEGQLDVPRPKGIVCLLALFEAIVRVARRKASMSVDEGLKPAQNGILSIYHRCLGNKHHPPVERLVTEVYQSPMNNAMELYCDSRYTGQESLESVPAISHRGLCFYLETLCDPTSNPADLALVHIVPGSILLDQRMYFEVRDAGPKRPQYPAPSEVVDTVPDEHVSSSPALTLKAIVMEHESHINFGYEASCSSGISWIMPASLSSNVSRALGRIHCSSPNCLPLGKIPPIGVINGEGDADNFKTPITVRLVSRDTPA